MYIDRENAGLLEKREFGKTCIYTLQQKAECL